MIYPLKNYQSKAVEDIKDYIQFELNKINRGTCSNATIVFQAPTGSGKTFIMASVIEDLCSELDDDNICFMWACPGNGELHTQSYNALKFYLSNNPPCYLLENEFFGSRSYIRKKEIVFADWQKLILKDKTNGSWKNNLMKDKETLNFLDVLKNTKANGTKIILIVDESHVGDGVNAKTRIKEFKEKIIDPTITIQMSATPADEPDVIVKTQDVIDEGMIKKSVVVNEGIKKDDESIENEDSEQLILQKGFDKRIELLTKYKSIGSNINPLVLIQIPNTEAGELKKEVIKDFLQERGITQANGKLKFWCDDYEDFDKKAIKENNDITEFLVFKTAVATGWDCPRAQILVKFREGHSETFETQTVGRILRTPEAKKYDIDLLDTAYIYTNIKEFEYKKESYNPPSIKTLGSYFREGYNEQNVYAQTALKSYYRTRAGSFNDATSAFAPYYFEAFEKYFDLTEVDQLSMTSETEKKFKNKGLDLDIDVSQEMIGETDLDMSKIDSGQIVRSDTASVQMAQNDVLMQFYQLIGENLNGLAYKRSRAKVADIMCDALYTYYNVFSREARLAAYQQLIVKNSEVFGQILSESTLKYRQSIADKVSATGEHYKFDFVSARFYSAATHCEVEMSKSLYQPLYVLKNERGKPKYGNEIEFLEYMNDKKVVDWLFENGSEILRTNFGISNNEGMNTFQPDFIIRFKDNTVGIFDTKAIDDRVEDTTAKCEALHEFIYQTNLNRGHDPMLRGGIVIKSGGQFYIFQGKHYHTFSESTFGWKNLNDFMNEVNANWQMVESLKNLG